MFTYDIGTFIVDSSGEVNVDFLFDGGGFQGELAVFSVEEMEEFTPGSTEFMQEAARRAITNSEQGHIIIQDGTEGALYSAELGYEQDYNIDSENYQGVKTFSMTPGDEVGFIMVQDSSIAEVYDNLSRTFQPGKMVIVSIPEANILEIPENQSMFVDVNGNGTIALEDIIVQTDRDYNDIIFQVRGLEGNLSPLENQIDPERDWRSTDIGQQLLGYTDSQVVSEDDTDSQVVSEGDIVYQFDKTDSQTQFYTTSEAERDYIQENLPHYEYQGESFMSAPNTQNNDLAGITEVYRFFEPDTGDHFYTASTIEKDYVIENLPHYTFEGIAYYGYESQQPDSIPMYRLYNQSLDAHSYTSSLEERDDLASSNYQLEGDREGVVFYIEPLET